MCDFKPGDEVVCVQDESVHWNISSGLTVGAIYTVADVFEDKVGYDQFRRDIGIRLVEVAPPGRFSGFKASWFRKVQRRDLSAWLDTATDFEEPTRTPAVEPA